MLDYRAFGIAHVEQGDQGMDSQRYEDSIRAQLGSLSGNGAHGTFTTGTFAFTEPELRKIITNWLDLAESYGDSIDKAHSATVIDGPGLEFASRSFATAANQSGKSLVEYLEKNKGYCLDQAQLAQNALDDYLGVEHTNVTDILSADQQGSRPRI